MQIYLMCERMYPKTQTTVHVQNMKENKTITKNKQTNKTLSTKIKYTRRKKITQSKQK